MRESGTAARVFELLDQRSFAELSGDANPLHVDRVAARRSLAGEVVVHGIHALLWALDEWIAEREGLVEIERLDVEFLRPMPVGDCVRVSDAGSGANVAALEIQSTDATLATIACTFASASGSMSSGVVDEVPPVSSSRPLAADQVRACRGTLPLMRPATSARRMFPHLADKLSARQFAALLASTRMVGMECPGLHSLFSELHLRRAQTPPEGLTYEVRRFDQRFGLTTIDVCGGDLSGTVLAFLRPAPQSQARSADLRQLVAPSEFSGQRALVVGGSRGLGEVLAKLLAAGGADVLLTYCSGEEDARAVVADIVDAGGRASCARFDVTEPDAARGDFVPTHLYYCATPFISAGTAGTFRQDAFERFREFYVTGFSRTLARFDNPAMQGVFYPSTVFVDAPAPGMSEYAAAKSEGEAVCASLEQQRPGLRVVRPRLLRLATDQTLSVGPSVRHDPVPVLLAAARTLAA